MSMTPSTLAMLIFNLIVAAQVVKAVARLSPRLVPAVQASAAAAPG